MDAVFIKPSGEREALETMPDKGEELCILNVYPQLKGQEFKGFGGAMTQAVGVVLESLTKEMADEALRACFSSDGLGYNRLRCPLDSCDFSTEPYCAYDQGQVSPAMDDRYIIPWIKRAYEIAGRRLAVMLSPWSPVAFMKDNRMRQKGGHLLPLFRKAWASYIVSYIEHYQDAGIYVDSVSIQNEPNAVQSWDSCIYTAEEEKAMLKVLYNELKSRGQDIKIYCWDHNKERLLDRALGLIDPETLPMIGGFAFHWYSGDHFEALSELCRLYPDKSLAFSEGCIEFSKFSPDDEASAAFHYDHEIIGNLRSGMDSFYDWNIVLDHQGGPNYVGNYCASPIMADEGFRSLHYCKSFSHIRLFSSLLDCPAIRLATTSFSPSLEAVAFRRKDARIVVFALNASRASLTFYVRCNGSLFQACLQPGELGAVLISL
jgi:glucosylceramidase